MNSETDDQLTNITAANVNFGTQDFHREAYFTFIQSNIPLHGSVFITFANRHGRSFAEWMKRELLITHYAVALSGETDDWQSVLSRSDYLIILLTQDSARDDSPVSPHVTYARNQDKPTVVVRCQPGFTPINLIKSPYIDAQVDRGAALRAVLDELQQKPPNSKLWISPGKVVTTSPELFIGRQDLLERFDRLMRNLSRDGRSIHVIYGRSRTGKSALIQQLKMLAEEEHHFLTLYADLDQLTMADENRIPADGAISSFWAQLLDQYPNAQQKFYEIQQSGLAEAMIWMRKMIVELAQERNIAILLDNLHADQSCLLIKLIEAINAPILVIMTSLHDELTPQLEFKRQVKTHTISMFQPREIGLLFNPPDFETSGEIVELSGGVPEITLDMLRYWLESGDLIWRDGNLSKVTNITLPNIWMDRLNTRMEAALATLPGLAELELEDLLDWLTCAATQGIVFSEKVLFRAIEDEFSPEQSAILLHFLAAPENPIIKPAECDLPLEDRCWQFSPAGLRALHLHEANAVEVAHYGERTLIALEQAAHPDPWRLRHRLHKLAKASLDNLLLSLQQLGKPHEEIQQRIHDSETYNRYQRYQGAIEQETRILGLRLQLYLVHTNEEQWQILHQLVQSMQNYEHNLEVATVCKMARRIGYQAREPGYEIAFMFYAQACVSRDNPRKALQLLKAGWRLMPESVGNLVNNPTGLMHHTPNTIYPKKIFSIAGRLIDEIGNVLSDLGDYSQALKHYDRALSLFYISRDYSGQANTLNNIGSSYSQLGDLHQAWQSHQQALSLFRTIRDYTGEAITLNYIGCIYDTSGDKQQALGYYEQALVLRRAVGDRGGEAVTLHNIGCIYDTSGDKQQALGYYEQALSLFRVVGDRPREISVLNYLGLLYSKLGNKEAALKVLNQALPLCRAIGDPFSEATTFCNIGWVYYEFVNLDQAIEYIERCINLSGSIEHPNLETYRRVLERFRFELNGISE